MKWDNEASSPQGSCLASSNGVVITSRGEGEWRVTNFWDAEKGGVMKNGPLKGGGSPTEEKESSLFGKKKKEKKRKENKNNGTL